MKSISVVVPVYNEEENVKKLHSEIIDACKSLGREYEVIFIDDGSTDKTLIVARELKPIKLIQMRKNFGQTTAMDVGIKSAKNDYIITMDGDLQNDPQDFKILIDELEQSDKDIISGWRKNRKDNFSKKFMSRGANFLRYILLKDGIHDSGCSLKIYKRECFEGVHLYGEMHRFIPAILQTKGFTVGEIVVNHRPRVAGITKYNWKRTFKGFVDMINLWFWSTYVTRPIHLFGSVGLITLLLASLTGLYTLFIFIFGEDVSNTAWPILTVLLIVTGVQLLIFGLMSDIIVKTYRQSTDDKSYSIKNIIER